MGSGVVIGVPGVDGAGEATARADVPELLGR
jgi:hypothetical protein